MPSYSYESMSAVRHYREGERPTLKLVDPYDEPLPAERRPAMTQPGYNKGREPANKGRRYPIEILTRNEVAMVLDVISATSWAGVRNRALVVTMYRAGVRVSEALHLRPKDIDSSNGMIRVLFGKGQRERTIGIDRGAVEFIEAWKEKRSDIPFPADSPLFCTLSGRMLWTSYVRQFLASAGRNAGVAKRVHSHGLRHTFAFELVMEGVQLPIVQKQLGHLWASSTAAYVDHIAPVDVVDRIRARTWVLPPSVRPATSDPGRSTTRPKTWASPDRRPHPASLPGTAWRPSQPERAGMTHESA